MSHVLEVLAPGMLATLQDTGRHGVHALGIGTAGAMDVIAARVGNLLLGNAERAAVLELTAGGVALRALRAMDVALCGADLEATLDGAPMPLCAPVRVDEGALLRLGRARLGWRACLAVRGGFAAEQRFGSGATDLRGGFGGVEGRALRGGDRLGLAASPAPSSLRRRIATTLAHPAWWHEAPLGLVMDEGGGVDPATRSALLQHAFAVSAQSDRMGLRLAPSLPAAAGLPQRVSAAVVFGTVQLPPDGKAIILGADRQTTGGYPVAGVVAGVDHWRIAQARPGDALRFRSVTPRQALEAWRARERELARLGIAAAAAWRDS